MCSSIEILIIVLSKNEIGSGIIWALLFQWGYGQQQATDPSQQAQNYNWGAYGTGTWPANWGQNYGQQYQQWYGQQMGQQYGQQSGTGSTGTSNTGS